MPTTRLRAALHRLTGRKLRVWHHAAYAIPIAASEQRLGIDPRRADNTLTWLLARHLIHAGRIVEAREATWEEIGRVHEPGYVDSLDDRAVLARILGVRPEIVPTAAIMELWRRGVGGTVDALRWAIDEGGCAINLSGGYHHARPDQGVGFCGLNDIAIAVRAARLRGYDGRIAILDLDAHPPDGIAACLDPDRDGVRVISVGVESAWDTPDWVRDHRVPPGAGDRPYLKAVRNALSELGRPDLVLVVAGSDPLTGDRYGNLDVSLEGLRRRDQLVFDAAGERPVVLTPAGGYTPNAWRVFASTCAVFADSAEVPAADFDPLHHRTRRIMRTLNASSDNDSWLTGADLAEALNLPVTEKRFLGHYTEQGMTWALTRYGLLDTVGRMGFDDVQVSLDTAKSPHLMRITAAGTERRDVLMELSASLRRIEELDTLFIEWLTMRDPRVPFTEDKPRLPGQDAPGLGLGDQALELLGAMVKRLDRDGVVLVPAHFHVAWMLRHRFQFLDPQLEGRFRALVDGLRHQPLERASRLLDGIGVLTEYDEVIRWEPAPMLWALSPRATERLEANRDEAERARRAVADALLPA